ncbi:hypothetical protein [Scytonema hofmannii]|nr:hypothetical protein [Scytonema hofmannii]
MEVKKIELTSDGWTLNILSKRVATITDPLGIRKTSYFGFNNEKDALAFQNYILEKSLCTRATVRQSERLTTNYECKVWSAKTELITFCATKDLETSSQESKEDAIVAIQSVR